MLYDPKWELRPSLAGFVAWLERQPADQIFDYWDCEVCACAQYATSLGMSERQWSKEATSETHPNSATWVELNHLVCIAGRTFGDVLAAARQALG